MYNVPSISYLQLELTTRCNASCPVCNRNINGGPTINEFVTQELSLDDIVKMFPKEILKNLSIINYCGNFGDAGYSNDLLPILRHFRDNSEKHLSQQVRTNGGMRNPEFWEEVGNFFIEKPPKYNNGVVWSVDGLDDTNHIYRRNVKWEKVYANMQAYAKTKAFGRWEYLLFEHNQHQVEEARQLAKSLGFAFSLKDPNGFIDSNSHIDVYNRDLSPAYKIYPSNYTGDKTIPQYRYTPPKYNKLTEEQRTLAKEKDIKCMAVHSTHQKIFVTSSGHLIPCCFLSGPLINHKLSYANHQFYEKISTLGLDKIDLRKRNMIDILQDKEFTNFFTKGWENKSIEDGRLLFCVETCGQ
jgi:MoaA/NifB/PqqE/SkfB family radical SAM enzyme